MVSITLEKLEEAGMSLASLPPKEKKTFSAAESVRKLGPELVLLEERGYSRAEIVGHVARLLGVSESSVRQAVPDSIKAELHRRMLSKEGSQNE